jgi:hypothetical protein
VRGKLPHLCAVVQYTEEPGSPGVLTWSQLLDIGRSVPDSLLQVSYLHPHCCRSAQGSSPGPSSWTLAAPFQTHCSRSGIYNTRCCRSARGPHLVTAPGQWPLRSRLAAPGQEFTISAAVGQPSGPHLVTAPGHWPLCSRLTAPGQEFTTPTAVGQPRGPHLATAPGHQPLRSRLAAPG